MNRAASRRLFYVPQKAVKWGNGSGTGSLDVQTEWGSEVRRLRKQMQRLRKQSFPQRYGNMLRSGTQKSRTTKANRKRGVSVSNTPVNRAPIRPILLCGRICAGKSTYAARLKQARGAVVLSCDRLMLTLFGQRLGSWHDGISERVRAYLLAQSVELLQAGLPVILDFGFWRRSDRLAADAFSADRALRPSGTMWRSRTRCGGGISQTATPPPPQTKQPAMPSTRRWPKNAAVCSRRRRGRRWTYGL